ncbi:hypothetical protein ABT095_14565 [Kitasatospora sp. NPDC002227]|uniref:hypothetical protein n=1 Tax=Kitasatospora sp. NPDC002227 TaxID=3154773 RepID=UPI00332C4C87
MTGELKLLQPAVRADLIKALKAADVTATPAAIIAATAEIVLQMKGHEHEPDDLFCQNLVGVLGQRAPYVLLRLLELEAELHRLRQRVGPDPAQQRAAGPGGAAGAALPVETVPGE